MSARTLAELRPAQQFPNSEAIESAAYIRYSVRDSYSHAYRDHITLPIKGRNASRD
jgi:hypothetical protein